MAAHHEWSKSSEQKLHTCKPQLVELCNETLRIFPLDIIIIEGARSDDRQEEMFRTGVSLARAGESKHNTNDSEPLSRAVDMAPLRFGKIEWDNRELWIGFTSFVRGLAEARGIPIRSGIDWDSDFDFTDHKLWDGPHFELD